MSETGPGLARLCPRVRDWACSHCGGFSVPPWDLQPRSHAVPALLSRWVPPHCPSVHLVGLLHLLLGMGVSTTCLEGVSPAWPL